MAGRYDKRMCKKRNTHTIKNEVHIDSSFIEEEVRTFSARGITEFSLHDVSIASDKQKLISILKAFEEHAQNVFFTILINPAIIDRNIINALLNINCSLEIPLPFFFDTTQTTWNVKKNLYTSLSDKLNKEELIFGFSLNWGELKGDTFRDFRDRLDFATTLYPNHIDFPQFFEGNMSPKPTGVYSSKDMEFSREMAFACRTFYTCGRAVPWFYAVIAPLKISPTAFFADFAEWQALNNCSFDSGWIPENAEHIDIEKMQLVFLKEKFEEKHKSHLYQIVKDLVMIHGAFSRNAYNGEESILHLSYAPDDILYSASLNIAKFFENATMEPNSIKVFSAKDYPDYKNIT